MTVDVRDPEFLFGVSTGEIPEIRLPESVETGAIQLIRLPDAEQSGLDNLEAALATARGPVLIEFKGGEPIGIDFGYVDAEGDIVLEGSPIVENGGVTAEALTDLIEQARESQIDMSHDREPTVQFYTSTYQFVPLDRFRVSASEQVHLITDAESDAEFAWPSD